MLFRPRGPVPEAARSWSASHWEAWLKRSAHLYYDSRSLADKRAAMSPFAVEPLQDTHPAEQLVREVRRFVPDGSAMSCAAMGAAAIWSPQDGARVAEFYLRILTSLGGLSPPQRLRDTLTGMVARLGPPLPRDALQSVLHEVVECAVARLSCAELLNLASMIGRRAYQWRLRPWRAQIELLHALLQHDGQQNFYENLASCLPELRSIINIRPAKYFLADTIVDTLGLHGVAKLLTTTPPDDATEHLGILTFAIVPHRVRRQKGTFHDLLLNADYTPKGGGSRQTDGKVAAMDADVYAQRLRLAPFRKVTAGEC
jgi:hypothetical protein